jgi:hypothetical protein
MSPVDPVTERRHAELARWAATQHRAWGMDMSQPGRATINHPGIEGLVLPALIPEEERWGQRGPMSVTDDPYSVTVANQQPDTPIRHTSAGLIVPSESGLIHNLDSVVHLRKDGSTSERLSVYPDQSVTRGMSSNFVHPAHLLTGTNAQMSADGMNERIRPRTGAVAYTNPDQFMEHFEKIMGHPGSEAGDARNAVVLANADRLKAQGAVSMDPVVKVNTSHYGDEEDTEGPIFWDRSNDTFRA